MVNTRPSEEAGIIPADAGSTEDGSDVLGVNRDHPRGCGEHKVKTVPQYQHLGSSPRMRGALPSIPTRPARCGDHPRGCGEHAAICLVHVSNSGSSPRMRGAQ